MNFTEFKLTSLTKELETRQERVYKTLGELQLQYGVGINDAYYDEIIEKEAELMTLGYVIIKLKELNNDPSK